MYVSWFWRSNLIYTYMSSLVAQMVKNPPALQETWDGSLQRSPGGGHGNPVQYSCLENPHGQRSLAGYSPWRGKESDMTDWLSTRGTQQHAPLWPLAVPGLLPMWAACFLLWLWNQMLWACWKTGLAPGLLWLLQAQNWAWQTPNTAGCVASKWLPWVQQWAGRPLALTD